MGDHDEEQLVRRTALKASIVGTSVNPPASIRDSDAKTRALFSGRGVLEPSYDPSSLLRIYENSSALAQNVASYVTNIDGLGVRLQPRIDLNSEDSFEKVRDALWIESIRQAELADPSGGDVDYESLMPSDEDVAAKIDGLKIRMRVESAKLNAFLESVSPNGSFESLRRKTREDREVTGNGYWEVLRDRAGTLARFVLVPPTHVRCTALDDEPTVVEEKVRVGLGYATVKQPKFFRRFVQAVGNRLVWFKEFGDPRVVSQRTGQVFADLAAFVKATAGTNDLPATELIHFQIHRTGEAYGVPRWVGNLLSVLGSRACDEVNYAYFDNKAIPPLALLVSGGRLSVDSVDKIETYIRDNIKGRQNFHSILVIEAEDEGDPLGPRELPKLKIERLVDAQQGDALFQRYDERNIDKVGSSFRLPRLLRGDVRDFNRSTADASLRFADEQIFEPERQEFDAWFNRVILPELGITMWSLRSLGPKTRDPERVAEIVLGLTKAGVLIPNEAREMASDVVGKDLESMAAPWAKQPLQLTLAGFKPAGMEDAATEKLGGWRADKEFSDLTSEAAANVARNNVFEESAGDVPSAKIRRAIEALDEAAAVHGADLLEGD